MCRLDQLDQPSVLIALNGGKTALDQQIGGSPCFERAADVIPQVHDLRDAEGGNIRQHCFKRDAVAMNVGYRSEFHRTRQDSNSRPTISMFRPGNRAVAVIVSTS
jgi:hypothetical protein